MKTSQLRKVLFEDEPTYRDRHAYSGLAPRLRKFYRTVEDDIGYWWGERHEWSSVNKVYDGIWIGNAESATDPQFLGDNNIQATLNMAIEITYYSAKNINLTKLGIHDGELAPDGVYEKAALAIHDARSRGENILVHCAAGISRSVTAVIAYLMLYEKIGYWNALDLIRQGRRQACPHPLLVRSLIRDFGSRFLQ